jgi:uncharacterized protein YndB with AHSA1/START domain
MQLIKEPVKSIQERELVVSRIFDAPQDLVWRTWTDSDRVKLWWGPGGFTAPVCRIDLRVGGIYLFCMRSPLGKDYWNTGVYLDIVPGERIVATNSFADDRGHIVPARYYGLNPALPLEMFVTATFEKLDSRTRLTLEHAGLPIGLDRVGQRESWSQSLEKFAQALKAPESSN